MQEIALQPLTFWCSTHRAGKRAEDKDTWENKEERKE